MLFKQDLWEILVCSVATNFITVQFEKIHD